MPPPLHSSPAGVSSRPVVVVVVYIVVCLRSFLARNDSPLLVLSVRRDRLLAIFIDVRARAFVVCLLTVRDVLVLVVSPVACSRFLFFFFFLLSLSQLSLSAFTVRCSLLVISPFARRHDLEAVHDARERGRTLQSLSSFGRIRGTVAGGHRARVAPIVAVRQSRRRRGGS